MVTTSDGASSRRWVLKGRETLNSAVGLDENERAEDTLAEIALREAIDDDGRFAVVVFAIARLVTMDVDEPKERALVDMECAESWVKPVEAALTRVLTTFLEVLRLTVVFFCLEPRFI